ncbi:MAG: NAD(P)/FAD-dependent oxidoreductase [Coriobacteriales bacterium]|nr:NAD(P)/FAD-dependent oxidoreductase [Coriobacteriales bacterium]
MKQYLIVGGGIAGIHCIEGIRSVDPNGQITMVCAEADSNYGRPLISYYLEGTTDAVKMSYRGEDFYERNGVIALHGISVTKLDPESKTAVLSDGQLLSYDAACVATGSSPFVPPMAGLDTVEHSFSFMTLADARALEQAVSPESRVLIIGGGLIGLKCAEGLYAHTHNITVVDLAPHVLSSILQPESAEVVEEHLREKGIELLLGDSAKEFQGNRAVMNSGATIEFDLLVVAIGVRPNTGLVKEAGGEVGRGIVTDSRMQTSLPDIYAAGDCTESRNIVTEARGVLAILPNASMQGHVAGINMAGGEAVYDGGIPMNSMGILGLHLMTAGSYYGEEDGGRAYLYKTEGGFKKLFTKDGFLTGFILMGDLSRTGIYTAMIRERRPLDSIDFETVFRNPSLIPFGRAFRRQNLGGEV